MKKIKWSTVKVKVKDLSPMEINPRKMSQEKEHQLQESIEEFDLAEIPVINTDGTLIAGHQRHKILMQSGRENDTIEVRKPNRQLTEKEVKKYNIISNAVTGEFDFDLVELHFNEDEFLRYIDDADKFLKKINEKNKYTRKVEIPIYEPKGEKPKLSDITDTSKYKKMIQEIEKAKISDEDKEFLKIAASRHISFNYERIADYYANSDKKVKNLMEKSALVIIDFGKAIENGFIELSSEIQAQYSRENGL